MKLRFVAITMQRVSSFCPFCGEGVEANWLFCKRCGARVKVFNFFD
jgi:uncharacterized protein (UPF0212 family)